MVIVDDSLFIRKAIVRVLKGDSRIRIIGMAPSGEYLLENIEEWDPEVVILDLSMPGMGGLQTLRKILEWKEIPVIIFSTHTAKGAPMTIEALHCGAVDFIDKKAYSLTDFATLRTILTEKITQVTRLKTHKSREELKKIQRSRTLQLVIDIPELQTDFHFKLLLIGASTGGPPAIQRLLEDIQGSLNIPALIVQHMPIGYTSAFARRLNELLSIRVSEIGHLERLENGAAYIAPAGRHVKIENRGDRILSILDTEPSDMTHCPSVDIMFQSACEERCPGVLAALLTGMGRDGARGLLHLKSSGAYTIVQNEQSSVVFGMPKAAVEMNAASEILHISKIGKRISQIIT